MNSKIRSRTEPKRVFYVLMIAALSFILASCAPETSTTPVLETSTPLKTATPTATPTPELTNTPQPTATKTPQASMTPKDGGIFVGPYDFPEWVSDPETEVLLTSNGGTTALINAKTFEILNLPFEQNTARWMPNGKQLWVHRDYKDVYIIDTVHGGVEHLPYDPYVQLTGPGILSLDGNYYFRGKKSDTSSTNDLLIIKRENEEILYQTDADMVLRDRGYAWSPVEPLILIYRNRYYPIGRENCECEVVIFDPRSQEFVFSMQGDFVNFSWSPDGSKMLYIRQSPDGALGDRLCIMEWRSETETCYQDGRSWHGGREIYKPKWLPNGNSISYLYWLPGGEENQIGGMCMIALDDNQITCPESLLPAGSYPENAYTWVVLLDWAPSSEMVFIYHGCPGCDYEGLGYLPYDALVAADGSRFFLFPYDPNRGRAYWRPALSP